MDQVAFQKEGWHLIADFFFRIRRGSPLYVWVGTSDGPHFVGDAVVQLSGQTATLRLLDLEQLTGHAEEVLQGLGRAVSSMREDLGESVTSIRRFGVPIAQASTSSFEALKARYYSLLGLNTAGVPSLEWHRRLAEAITGFAVQVTLPPGIPGAPEGAVIVDQPVSDVAELREALKTRLPGAARKLEDSSLTRKQFLWRRCLERSSCLWDSLILSRRQWHSID